MARHRSFRLAGNRQRWKSRRVRYDDDVRRSWQSGKRKVIGSTARNWVWHTDHHRAGRINDRIVATEVTTSPCTAKRHGDTVAGLNSRCYPHDATSVDIGFQRGNGRCVVGKKVRSVRVVPVKDYHAIITEIEPIQVCGRKLGISVPSASDGILNSGKTPWVVRFKQRKLVWRWLAIGKGVINRVTSQSGSQPFGRKPWSSRSRPTSHTLRLARHALGLRDACVKRWTAALFPRCY